MKKIAFLLIAILAGFASCKKDDPVTPNNNVPPEELPEPKENTIIVSNVVEFEAAVKQANQSGNVTILFKDGTYELNQMAYITGDNVDFRSQSGNRDAVILKGKGPNGNVGFIFNVEGKNLIVGNLTLGWVSNHGIQIHGEADADNALIHNVRFVNTGEQMLKVSYNSSTNVGADDGTVQYCLFEYTAGVGPQYYIGGVDAHYAKRWNIRYNTFKHIRSPETRLAEHAIHFWSNSENTVVEGNTIINCDRGIGFGMGDRGHIGGIIKNNMVYTSRDVGIGLENAKNVAVYNNSLFTANYSNAIEYRFSGTSATIINNLCDKNITERDGASGNLENNVTNIEATIFVDPQSGDLHLNADNSSVSNAGKTLSDVIVDFDRENRPVGAGYDIGADEKY